MQHVDHWAGEVLVDIFGVKLSVFSSVCWFQARQTAQQKKQAAEESRKDYVSSLNQFNQDQHQHYHTLVPVIYQVN